MIEQIYERKMLKDIEKYLDLKEAIVIYGARQVGKTTLLKYLIENNLKDKEGNVFYFDLELMNLLELCNQGPEKVHDYLIEKGYASQGEIN